MQEFIQKINAFIGQYEEVLFSLGIRITVSKKYFESSVQEYRTSNNSGSFILNSIATARDRQAEKEKGYDYQPNRYHCVILTVSPTEKNRIPKDECKEYAFLLKKVERVHIGLEPESIAYEENKILSKIEKRLHKIIRKAQKTGAVKTCRNTFGDAIHYAHSTKYEYKKRFCHKDRFFWDLFFGILAGTLAILVVLAAWVLSKWL